MRLNRMLLSVTLVVVALVIQVSVLARLHLPGAVPDLVLLTVIALAMVYGHVGGALIGFGAGLLSDLAPPADHAAGRYALVLCVIGYLAGLVKPENGRLKSATAPMAVVVVAAIGSTLLYAGVGALVGDTAARHVGLASLLFTAALYDLLLAPFVVPVVMALARRAENDPLAEASSSAAGGDVAAGWLSSGTGLRIGGQRGGLRVKAAKARVGPRRTHQGGQATVRTRAVGPARYRGAARSTERGRSEGSPRTASPCTRMSHTHTERGRHSSDQHPGDRPDPTGPDPARRHPDSRTLPPRHPRRPPLVPPDPQRRRIRQGSLRQPRPAGRPARRPRLDPRRARRAHRRQRDPPGRLRLAAPTC